jgi:hypothetical protein
MAVQSLPEQVRSPLPPWDPTFPGAFFLRERRCSPASIAALAANEASFCGNASNRSRRRFGSHAQQPRACIGQKRGAETG